MNESRIARPPGERPVPAWGIIILSVYLVALTLFLLYSLMVLWPRPTPSGREADTPMSAAPLAGPPARLVTVTPGVMAAARVSPALSAASIATPSKTPLPKTTRTAPTAPLTGPLGREPSTVVFFGHPYPVWNEVRLLLIVVLAGAVGSLLHTLRSLYWYVGNRELVMSWLALYLLVPFAGALLALVFYLVVRGGFFSARADLEDTSPFGFAALGALVGMFSQQASLKLEAVAETLFAKPTPGKDAHPQTAVGAQPMIRIDSFRPSAVPHGVDATIVVAGAGFAPGAVADANGAALPTTVTGTGSLEIRVPAGLLSSPGSLSIGVTNPSGEKATTRSITVT